MRPVLFFAILSWSISASADIVGSTSELDTPRLNTGFSLIQPSRSAPSVQPGIYEFSANGEVQPAAFLSGLNPVDNVDNIKMSTNAGEAVHVEPLASGELLLTFHLPQNELGKVPSQMIVSAQEFAGLGLKFKADGKTRDLYRYESGYTGTKYASNGRRSSVRARRHTVSYKSRRSGQRHSSGLAVRDANGRLYGHDHNCVATVYGITGLAVSVRGAYQVADAYAKSGKYHYTSLNDHARGVVCSWTRHGHLGHVGVSDGTCFVPTYQGSGSCGDPGPEYHKYRCVAPNTEIALSF